MQEGVASLEGEIAQRKAKIGAMTQEQERIRENMKSVAETSEYYKRFLKKLDDQETALETLQREITSREPKLAEQREQLKNYLAELNVG
jgi:chromosome segregation ATPase